MFFIVYCVVLLVLIVMNGGLAFGVQKADNGPHKHKGTQKVQVAGRTAHGKLTPKVEKLVGGFKPFQKYQSLGIVFPKGVGL